MRFYTNQHKHYCGIDLHANKMYVCVIDSTGSILVHKNIDTESAAFLRLIAPYREDLIVGVECMFCWYWLADLCRDEGIQFVIGHALYMKAIHGGKAKDDKIASHKLAALLRGGMFPLAYTYPREMRATRDLTRRRLFFVNKRAELLKHISMTYQQYNLKFDGPILKLKAHSNLEKYANPFTDNSVRQMIDSDLYMIKHYNVEIHKLEWFIKKTSKEDSSNAFDLALLKTTPGIGDVLSTTLLYEIHSVDRFPTVQHFSSYARLIKPKKTSAGKNAGSGGSKIGNHHLKWAFSEAAVLLLRQSDQAKLYLKRLERRHPKRKALSVLSHRLGKAVYFMLSRKEGFNAEKFFAH